MSLKFEFVKVTNNRITEFIHQAKHRILFVKPAFYKCEIENIISVKEKNNIPLCELYLENGDEAIRFGFGERDALELISEKQDLLTVQLVDRIRLSILIVDNNCLIFSPSIAQLDKEDNPSDFPNGFYGDKNVVEMIITKFPTYTLNTPINHGIDEIEAINNPFEEIEEIMGSHHKGITQELEKTINQLDENPPINPSKLHKINIYRNNYKILKRQLIGIKVKNKKINLKSFYKMLSTNNERLLSSWNIFTNDDIRSFQDMTFFENELQLIDNDFLLDIGRFGLLIETSNKEEYQKRVNTTKQEFIDFLNGDMKEGKNRFLEYRTKGNSKAKSLNQVLEDSRSHLIKYLLTLANAEESFELKIFDEDRSLKREYENENINIDDVFITFISNFVDNKLKFPNKEELIEKIDIKNDIYDISDELLNNNEDFDFYIKKYDLDNLRRYNEGYEQKEMVI